MGFSLIASPEDVVDLPVSREAADVLVGHAIGVGVVVFGAHQVPPRSNAEVVGARQQASVIDLQGEL